VELAASVELVVSAVSVESAVLVELAVPENREESAVLEALVESVSPAVWVESGELAALVVVVPAPVDRLGLLVPKNGVITRRIAAARHTATAQPRISLAGMPAATRWQAVREMRRDRWASGAVVV